MILKSIGVNNSYNANTISEAKKLLKKINPDFAILDLYIGDRIGFELINYFNSGNIPVIIITGHPKPKYIEQATNFNVEAFISKPPNSAILKFEFLKILKKLKVVQEEPFMFFKTKYALKKIYYSDIIYIRAEGNYSTIVTKTNKHVIKKSLTKLSTELPREVYAQVHRSTIINISKVQSINLSKNSITLDDHVLSIGNKYKSILKELIKKNNIVIEF